MIIPELGPLLGSLVEPSDPTRGGAALDAQRLFMVGALFERARIARELLAKGDEAGARVALGGSAWLDLWDDTVRRSAAALSGNIEQRIRDAAAYSRYPRKRLPGQLPSEEDQRILAARLSAAGIGLESAVTALEGSVADWQPVLRLAAGELEQAWHRLIRTALEELEFWGRRVRALREWRRPWFPLLAGGAVALAVVSWIGLMLGGYLPVPDVLRPAAEWIWNLSWP